MTFRSSVRRFFTPGMLTCLVVLSLLVFVFSQFFCFLRVTGHSMDPSLADGQVMIGVSAAHTGLLKVSRGDIVIADCPQLELTIIKRVVGLPGDRLQFTAGQLYLNGQLYYEPYIYEPMQDDSLNNCAEFTVPEGHYFLMGDNRNRSLDSRKLGFFRRDQLLHLVYPRHQPQLTAIVLVCMTAMAFLSVFLSERISHRLCRWFPSFGKAGEAEAGNPDSPQPAEKQNHSLVQKDEAMIFCIAFYASAPA